MNYFSAPPLSVSFRVRTVALCALVSLGMLAASAARGQAPAEASTKLTAPQLFPEKTLAYLRVDNVKELKEAFSRSSLGKLSHDDQIRPILAEFYGSLVNSTDVIRERLGLNLDELLSIPTGELAVAILPGDGQPNPPQEDSDEEPAQNRRGNQPCVAIMMDAGEEISGVQVVLERVQSSVGDRMTHQEKKLGSLTLHLFANPERAREQFGYFIDQGVFIACSDIIGLERLAKRWSGGQVDWPTLAENRRFTTIMSRCVGTQGERPQVSFFADPLAFFHQVAPNRTSANMVFAMLPALGLNDIQAVGGSWIVAPPDFDSISHLHVLLGSPRRAVLALVRPKSGSTMPEDWVPASVSSYSTINWDIASTLQGIEQLYDQFQYPGAMKAQVFDRISERLQPLDFKKDILDNLEGRLTMVQGLVRPIRLNSASNVYGIRLKNPDYFAKNVLPTLMKMVQERQEIATENFGRFQVQVFTPGRMPASETLRQPEICVTIINDYLVIADSRFMMTEVTSSLNSPEDRLSQALEFQLISDRIKAQLQDKESSALMYSRPEESLQMFYELARDPANRDRLRQVSANNGFFKALLAALDNHKLPDFSVIAKYLAPSGGFIAEEETGLHYTSFTLRRD